MKKIQLPLFTDEKPVNQSLSELLLRGKKKEYHPEIPDWELREATERFNQTTRNIRLLFDYEWDGSDLKISEARPPKNAEEEFENLVEALQKWNSK